MDVEIPSLERVSSVLPRPGCGSYLPIGALSPSEEMILKWGSRAFPAYEAILADLASDVWDVFGACDAIHQVKKVKRRQFIHLVLQRLIAPDALVRPGVTTDMGDVLNEERAAPLRREVWLAAIFLLGEIGSESETIHIRPFLYHNDASLQYEVLSTLAKIGGKRDLGEVNLWLCNPPTVCNQHLIRRVEKCRDELEDRLRAHTVPKQQLN